MKVVLASSNLGKLEELRQLLAPLGIELVSQQALGIEGAEETATTFVENALATARHASRLAGLAAMLVQMAISRSRFVRVCRCRARLLLFWSTDACWSTAVSSATSALT